MELPFVSVIVPVRNEAPFIEKNLKSLLEQSYPKDKFEILAIDGMSDDGTRSKIDEISLAFPQVRGINNPGKIVAAAFNLGIKNAKGEIILIVGGHTLVAPNYIEENVRLLNEHPEVAGTGGPVQPIAKSTFGKAVAIAMSHPLGIGNATHRYPDFEGYAFGSAFPAFRRSVFDQVGLYDERFIRNQDDEFFFRMQILNIKNFISPRVRASYYVRETPHQLFKQYEQYGFWRVPVLMKHKRPASLRQIAPVVFFSLCAMLWLLYFVGSIPFIAALIIPALYTITLALVGFTSINKHGLSVSVRVPFAIFILHFAYAYGTFKGFLNAALHPLGFKQDEKMASLSR